MVATRMEAAKSAAARRPFGVYVIALFQAMGALTSALYVVSDIRELGVRSLSDDVSLVVPIALAVLGFSIALGLLLLRREAWVAAMLWVGVTLAGQLLSYFRGNEPDYATMVISAAEALYLNLSDVQGAFRR